MNNGRVLGLIGCGNMSYALVSGLKKLEQGFEQIIGFDVAESRLQLFASEFSVQPALANAEVAARADLIILAVKPQQIATVLDEIHTQVNENKLLVSIAAGITTESIEKRMGQKLPVIRVMPNTPCLVGEGASAVARGSFASAEDGELVLQMFSALGRAIAVPESYMDAVTAVAGSGPAFIYLVAEAMMDAGVEVGLPRDIASAMVLQTMRGAVAMMENTEKHPAILREQVTSPGGTTIAGLRQLEEVGLRKAFFRAIHSAYERSVQQGKG